MICRACGRTAQNPNSNYCDYCGTRFSEEDKRAAGMQFSDMRIPRETSTIASGNRVTNAMPIYKWVGFFLLTFLSIPGMLAQFVILCIWATKKENTDKRNFAVGMLVFVGIMIIILLANFGEFSSMYSQILGSMLGGTA